MFVATQWNCPQCATQDISGEVCPSCGWHKDGANGQTAALVVTTSGEPVKYTADSTVFILRRGNTGFAMGRSRRVRFYYTGWFLFMVVATTILIAVLLSYLISQWNIVNVLEQSGISVQASVTNRRVTSGKSSSYYLTYQFSAHERLYQREQQVGYNTYSRFPTKAKVNIRYLASDPTISLLAGDAADNSSLSSLTTVSAIWCIGMFIGTAYLGVKSLRYGRMAREGTLIQGEVVTCMGTRGSKGSWFVSLRYAFRAPDGQIIEKTEKEIRNDLKNKAAPRPGTPVAVLYVNEKLFEVM